MFKQHTHENKIIAGWITAAFCQHKINSSTGSCKNLENIIIKNESDDVKKEYDMNQSLLGILNP